MRKPKSKIWPEVMNWHQVRDYLGGNIGRDKIMSMMKEGKIPSSKIGNRYVVKKKDIDMLIDIIFDIPIQNGIIESFPVKHLHKIVRSTVG